MIQYLPEYKTIAIAEYCTKMLNDLIVFRKYSRLNTEA